ncbi:acyl-CoA dehydrogenase family protein [Frankia sp. ArI3]|uniref:acyl-CoA dehydrogenase family protein n=1 Tax=Frankia sp. ArI3 TaxID=1858 RepID=UPI002104E6B3|nr:acyl-CoA dehydrogenase family protein [Frankia sp. ArI3]
MEELGRAGSPLPLGQAALVARLLDQIGIGAAVSDAVAEGAALAVPAAAEPDDAAISGAPGPDGTLTLAGRAAVVVGGLGAAWLLASAAIDDDRALALVPAASATRTARTTLDLSRDIAAVDLHGVTVPAGDWARVGAGVAETLDQALAIIHTLDAVGAAGRLLDMTVGYVKEREQFGRPVGSFQAVKHHAATMAVDIEAARLCGHDAARALDSGDLVAAGTAVAVAGSVAGEGTSRAASTALQLHGGMGFTWEHDLHLFLRRIKVDELVRGTPRQHRERLIATAG